MIKELLSHAHIGVTAGVYVQLRLQRQAIETLGDILHEDDAPEGPPPSASIVR
ncbi:integrase [Wenjunlia tyrosinilytica]|uniref:Uncharacterized protein n=1 Tax=Wenjunlia tyrosinilytica TaxID=1544741 RepID=A0A918E1N7_9ACTN|nr:hypothetical protein GCM10012280_71680 [Wenjunlia tyrosinilytica]